MHWRKEQRTSRCKRIRSVGNRRRLSLSGHHAWYVMGIVCWRLPWLTNFEAFKLWRPLWLGWLRFRLGWPRLSLPQRYSAAVLEKPYEQHDSTRPCLLTACERGYSAETGNMSEAPGNSKACVMPVVTLLDHEITCKTRFHPEQAR